MRKCSKEIYICDICKSEYEGQEGRSGSVAFLTQKATETTSGYIDLCPECSNELYLRTKGKKPK